MPEGDTLHRTADGLRPYLVGRPVTAARANGPGPIPQVERLVGSTVTEVESVGKNLLIRFDDGLELRTHLRMNGSWHRYRPGERWRRPPIRARLVLEVPGAVAVCFDAPVVELLETRAERLHPALGPLGPDLLHGDFGPRSPAAAEVVRRLRDPLRVDRAIAEALLDQRALAGIGNVYKSEVLFLRSVDPFLVVHDLSDDDLLGLIGEARRVMLENVDRSRSERVTTGAARRAVGPLWVYARAGRPCRRCGSTIRSERHGDLPRLTYWCPRCQRSRATDIGRAR
jgi:endonuclease-8